MKAINTAFDKLLPEYTSYCFRHGLESRLAEIGIQQEIINYIMGYKAAG